MSYKIRKNIVLLAGGIGKRLWPLSKKSYPKQFISIPNLNFSTFQLAINNSLKIAENSDIIITANKEHKLLIESQINALGFSIDNFRVIFEDNNINTAQAIYDSCCFILDHLENDNITYFFPTDHVILDNYNLFINFLEKIDIHRINLFGELALEVCSNFGYMVTDRRLSAQYYNILKFIEKPSINQYQAFKDKLAYRNLGIYLSRPSILREEFHNLCKDMNFSNDSIDKIISEKSKIMNLIEIKSNWKDIGSIKNMYEYYKNIEFDNINIKEEDIYKFNQLNSEFRIDCYDNGKFQLIKK